MSDAVENDNPEIERTELPSSDVPSAGDPTKPETGNPSPAKSGNFFSRFFRRNGRHPQDCQCPIHRKAGVESRFVPPSGQPQVASPQPDPQPGSVPDPLQVAVSINPKRFEIWGKLAGRLVRATYHFLTAELPAKACKVFGDERGKKLTDGLELKDDAVLAIEEDVTRLAIKYNLTTGFDEEISLAVNLATVFGPVIMVNKRLDAALKEIGK